MSEPCDVLVVGAGPAGAAAAIRAAENGARVLIVDRSEAAGAKPCGGCLNERALAALDDLGVGARVRAAGAIPLDRVELIARRRSRVLPLGGSAALSRARLDAILAERAVEAGAVLQRGVRATVRAGDGAGGRPRAILHGLGIDGACEIEPRVAIVADGLAGSAWAPPEGPARRNRGRAVRIGVAAVLEGRAAPPIGTVRMAVARGGYVGLVRLEDGRIDCAAAVDPRCVRATGSPAAFVRSVLVDAGAPVPDDLESARWRGTGRLEGRRGCVAASGVLVAGDAAHDAEPFTGDGIGAALAGGGMAGAAAARIAARGWRTEDAAAWTAAVRAERRARLANRAVARLLRAPAAAGAVFAVVAAWPTLAGAALARLGRPQESGA